MIIKPKNTLLVLSAFLVIALGIVGYVLYSQNVLLGTVDNVTNSLRQQGTTDDTSSIEKDLNSTNMNSFDSDLNNVQKQISQ